jgi:hypothetical protein
MERQTRTYESTEGTATVGGRAAVVVLAVLFDERKV